MKPNAYAFFQGRIVPLEEANINITTHALHYGTGAFEGIRGNWNEEREVTYIFKLREHYERLITGCELLMLDIPYSVDELCTITVDLVKKCGYRSDIYIRPLAYKSETQVANLKLHELASDLFIIIVPFGNYLEGDSLRCCTSSWQRTTDTTIPPRFKLTGGYINSVLAKTEAILAGFDEAILLNKDGNVSEGSGENLFIVKKGKLFTPPLTDNILPGVTRNTLIQIAKEELGLEVEETHINRTELYTADECILTGTAAHVTPVVELDNRKIGKGTVGPISKSIRELYFEIVKGNHPKYMDWCTPADATK